MKCPKCKAKIGMVLEHVATESGRAAGTLCYLCGYWVQSILSTMQCLPAPGDFQIGRRECRLCSNSPLHLTNDETHQEAKMTRCMEDRVVHLQGDLTHSGVTHGSIDSLAVSLRHMGSEGEKNLRIDCGRIRATDVSGLQLLYVWMQCARFQGMEPQLVNLPESMQQAMQNMGASALFHRQRYA